MPVRLARGHASAEELSAVVAIVAVLAAAEDADDPDRSDGHSAEHQMPSRSPWSAPSGMVRKTYPHGPGGWRASASPC
ncbi:MAG: acyl-CoA carboxylase subunit epsilon [Dermatophilaceae bacterium]|nr:acyl-CoA carboxylase subunit epsilon [Dermatophilaceae bacterium]